MFSVVLIPLLAGLIVAISIRTQRPEVDHRITLLLLGSYAFRLCLSPLAHGASLFTTGGAVDSSSYERIGAAYARMWSYNGIQFVGSDDLPNMALPVNVYALVQYLNGGPAHLGCVAIIAAAASFVCLDVYLLCLELGSRREVALKITVLISALPSFLYYTSDTYKDGFVALFVMGILGCSVRLSRRFSVTQIALAGGYLGGLWFTRYYLVFVMPAPLLLGVLGLRSGSVFRILLAVLFVGTSVTAAYAYSDVPTTATRHAMQTFEGATNQVGVADNARVGSGVIIEEDAPLSGFPVKLAYTLFAPFPWQAGSLGLQMAKLEVIVWYYFFYRALRAARAVWRAKPENLLIFFSFIIPMTIAYAFSFSNIGLIVRERMAIVLATIVFASGSWSGTLSAVSRDISRSRAALSMPLGGARRPV